MLDLSSHELPPDPVLNPETAERGYEIHRHCTWEKCQVQRYYEAMCLMFRGRETRPGTSRSVESTSEG